MVRSAWIALYAALAALGAALLARPAVLWIDGLGLYRPVRPWQVPSGWSAALLVAVLAAFTFRIALRAARGGTPRRSEHLALLVLVALAVLLRAVTGDIRPPRDPAPRLLDGLRAAAAVLDAEYPATHRYRPTAGLVQGALSALPAPGFAYRGRQLPLSARILHGMRGPQIEALPGDPPGTVYVCISADEQRAWLSALSLHAVLPAMVRATAGTHSAPGLDALLPLYPNALPVPR
jgi:hypothetical protein